eukprot:CAMPEP_0173088466 /NCGR_PEP_ID=MMETSP1102-20130122/24967_1 /TAXON_ID=49646 /ORGANISM="Geminigera sp., Strain Caron Lab Isolate" /LENGTH=42 /DNA_ID= /DNA_START= /DNA_END= /DNA_ORIENTATION=
MLEEGNPIVQNHGTPTAKTESSTQDDLAAGIEKNDLVSGGQG